MPSKAIKFGCSVHGLLPERQCRQCRNLLKSSLQGKGAIKAEAADLIGAQSGMLFAPDAPGAVCLWMKETLIPLSVAFIDNAGQVVQIIDLKPYPEQLQCAPAPIRTILEVNRHRFDQNDVRPANRVDLRTAKPIDSRHC